MIKQVTKTEFLLKTTLAFTFAIVAGGEIAFTAEYFHVSFSSWIAGFVYTFYPFACIVIMQWLLLSDYLPKWWVALGFVGCAIAGTTVGIIFHFITNEFYNMYDFEIGILRAFISGILLAFPQLFILKGKKGYLWVLANGIGWAIPFIVWRTIFFPPVHDSFLLAFLRMLVLESPRILFGLVLGLYLYTYVYKPSNVQT